MKSSSQAWLGEAVDLSGNGGGERISGILLYVVVEWIVAVDEIGNGETKVQRLGTPRIGRGLSSLSDSVIHSHGATRTRVDRQCCSLGLKSSARIPSVTVRTAHIYSILLSTSRPIQ